MVKVGENLRVYAKDAVDDQTKEAAARAAMELVKKIRRDSVNGEVDPFLASPQALHRQVEWAHSKLSQRKPLRGLVGVPNKMKEDAKVVVSSVGQRDDDGREIQVGDPRIQPRLQGDPDFTRVLATALLPRIIKVLSTQRATESVLSADQIEACWVMFRCFGAPVAIPEEHGSVTELFEPGEKEWRSHLARVRVARQAGLPLPDMRASKEAGESVQQSSVTSDVKRVRRLIATCLYLFVTLAPYSNVVQDEAEMKRLLDLVFVKSAQLSVRRRDLLRKAGGCVRFVDSAYRVDTVAAHAAVRQLQSFKKHTLAQMVDDLHAAEAKYAIHVPGQDRFRPRFDCVKRCAAHSSESMKP